MDNANGKEYKLPSGASLYVSIGPWGSVKPLHDAVARAAIGSGITRDEVAAILKAVQFKLAPAPDPKAKLKADEQLTVLSVLARKILEVGSSKELETAIFTAAEKCIYRADGSPESSVQFKFSAPGYGVFDHPNCRDRARGDYYEICASIVEENLRPFAEALYSALLALAGKSADTQASNTETGSDKPK